ncbi:SET domain-containing protein [Trametes meyenii]|nr:SET domain-containing protein [Trametes meyenii]
MDLLLFLNWLKERKITLHDDIAIVASPDGGISVVSNSSKPILHPQTVASIPKSAILSVRSCALAEHIQPVHYGHGATLSLTLALYSEILRGTQSEWYPYIESLPSVPVPIGKIWDSAAAFPGELDAKEAALWIHGTEVQKELQDDDGCPLLDETCAFFESDVQPLLISMGAHPTLQGFLRAYSLVCSRAFLVDSYHGLSMVPVADAFNHTHENHVQLGSDFDVCPTCGSLAECPHDREDPATPLASQSTPTYRTPPHSPSYSADTVDMLTVRSIPPGAEVFNTYGTDLGNASLIARYGFALDGAENDCVTFGWPGSGILLDSDRDQDVFRAVVSRGREMMANAIQNSALVYTSRDEELDARLLAVNSDGQISLGLFIWAVWDALTERPPPELLGMSDSDVLAALPGFLPQVAGALVKAETVAEEGNLGADPDNSNDFRVIAGAADALASLCRTRVSKMGKKIYRGATIDTLSDVLDGLPPERAKTKLILEYLLSERALLEACAAGWEDLRDSLATESTVDGGSDLDP